MDDHSLIRSMSKKGYSPDNAACEGSFGRLDRGWTNMSVDEFIEQLNAHIIWYNSKRISGAKVLSLSKKMSAPPFV